MNVYTDFQHQPKQNTLCYSGGGGSSRSISSINDIYFFSFAVFTGYTFCRFFLFYLKCKIRLTNYFLYFFFENWVVHNTMSDDALEIDSSLCWIRNCWRAIWLWSAGKAIKSWTATMNEKQERTIANVVQDILSLEFYWIVRLFSLSFLCSFQMHKSCS